MERFRRDFETDEQYKARLRDVPAESFEQLNEEPASELPSLWVADCGPVFNSRANERLIAAEAQRIFELDQRDRIPR